MYICKSLNCGNIHQSNIFAVDILLFNRKKKTDKFKFVDNCQGNVKFDFSCHFSCVATNVGDEGGFAPNIQDNKEGEISLMNISLIFHQ